MKKVYKTEKNLQKVWDNLDEAYEHIEKEHIEKAIEDLSLMSSIPDEVKRDVERFDISAISCLKCDVEELISRLKGEF